MKCKVLALLLCACFSTSSLAEPLWKIDVEQIEDIAIRAVNQKYPEIPLDGLASEFGLSVICYGERFKNRIPIPPKKDEPCHATTTITVLSTVTEERYTNEKGECRLKRGLEPISLEVYIDGCAHVGGRGAWKEGKASVDCP